MEKLRDFSWTYLSYGVMIVYHYLVLFPIAVVSRFSIYITGGQLIQTT